MSSGVHGGKVFPRSLAAFLSAFRCLLAASRRFNNSRPTGGTSRPTFGFTVSQTSEERLSGRE